MNQQSVDQTDKLILQYLIEDASRSYKEIGSRVHMTGQAVGGRVKRMQEMGIIEGHTLRWNPEKLGLQVHAFVTVFLQSPRAFTSFLDFAEQHEQVIEVHRVSGEGCYLMKVRASDADELNELLDKLVGFASYKLSLSMQQVK